MTDYPRRGGRVSLECSCEGRVVDWALLPWGDRLFAVELLGKGDRCHVARHRSGRRVSMRSRKRGRRRTYFDPLA